MLRKRKIYYIKEIALSNIFILVMAIIALSFSLSQTNIVSADSHTKGLVGPTEEELAALDEPDAPGFTKESAKEKKDTGEEVKTSEGKSGTQTPTGTSTYSKEREAVGKKAYDTTTGDVATKEAARLAAQADYDGKYDFGGEYGVVGSLGRGIAWSIAVVTIVGTIAALAGQTSKQTIAITASLVAGIMAGQLTYGIINSATGPTSGRGSESILGAIGIDGVSNANVIGAAVGVIVTAVVFALTYKKEGKKTIHFTCDVYEPPVGGSRCEDCNKDPFRPCSEYRCKSLGQACELLNKETPGRETCAWVNPKDVNSPTITPWIEALSPTGLSYISDTSVRPPALGVRIIKGIAGSGNGSSGGMGCLQAFTPLKFGLVTNEPTQCRVDFNHTKKYADMQYEFGESTLYEYNHTQVMRLPGPEAFNVSIDEGSAPIFQNDGTTQLFVRCRDANGNENADEYSVKFCVDKSPDTTPPFIEGNSITSGNPVRFGTTNLSIETYVNEPAECRWSIESKNYDDMENKMNCINEVPQVRNGMVTTVCIANLTGLKDNAENKFYFRCKDHPEKEEKDRNVMVQSYEYILKGSQHLNIIKVSPNGTVSGSSDAVSVDLEVETDDGAEEGKAVCLLSPLGTNGTYVQMFATSSFQHKQTLQLITGTYTYHFMCTDIGGNTAQSKTTFSVFSDRTAPQVARVYKEVGTGLKVVTNEDAECAYSLTSCNFVFNEGLKLIYSNPSIKTNSFVEWKANVVYYIKCRDLYGNEPSPNECSVIVKPVDTSASI